MLQALPYAREGSEAVASRLREELLSPKLDGIAADVAHAGKDVYCVHLLSAL